MDATITRLSDHRAARHPAPAPFERDLKLDVAAVLYRSWGFTSADGEEFLAAVRAKEGLARVESASVALILEAAKR